jgi:hypothetical protein
MKLEREKDIPAFKGKSWRERWVLHNQARERDPWIFGLRLLGFFLILAPTAMLANWLGHRFFPHHSFLAVFGVVFCIYIVLGLAPYMLFNSLFIVPRIRRVLESNIQTAA